MAKVALITGCSKGGIGDAIAQAFLKEGVQVFATARDMEKVTHLKEMGCEVLLLDVLSTASIENAVNTVKKQRGRLDFLVNNAGRGHTCPLADVNLESAIDTFNLNVISALAVTQAFLPLLIAAKAKVINIGSIGGKVVTPFTGIYAASKAALNSMSETLRVELAPFGVQVITVIAGTIDTGLYQNQPIFKLKPGSIYTPIEDNISAARKGEGLNDGSMKPSQFARALVRNALQKSPVLWYWYGAKTTIVWIITTFFPHCFLDPIISKTSGLATLKNRL